jgi:hypothetical protein
MIQVMLAAGNSRRSIFISGATITVSPSAERRTMQMEPGGCLACAARAGMIENR